MGGFRIMSMRPQTYGIALSALCAVGFAVGCAVNFVHARNHPGADPYRAGAAAGTVRPR